MKKMTKLIAFRMSDWEYSQLENALKIIGHDNKSRFIVMAILEKAQKIIKTQNKKI